MPATPLLALLGSLGPSFSCDDLTIRYELLWATDGSDSSTKHPWVGEQVLQNGRAHSTQPILGSQAAQDTYTMRTPWPSVLIGALYTVSNIAPVSGSRADAAHRKHRHELYWVSGVVVMGEAEDLRRGATGNFGHGSK